MISTNYYLDRGYCLGYVAAIADVFVGTGTCVPEHTTNGQLAEMVAQALQNDPAHRNIVASFIVMEL
jgi:hypothetical protein